MIVEKHHIEFFTPALSNDVTTCGCSSYGIATCDRWVDPGDPCRVRWQSDLRSVSIAGTFTKVLSKLALLPSRPSLILVFVTGTPGTERFLTELCNLLPGIPVAGGGAAWISGESKGLVSPDAPDVSLLAVLDGEWSVETKNLFDASRAFRFRREGARELVSIQVVEGGRFVPAIEALAALQSALGKESADHESITFSDQRGRNIHFHERSGSLIGGADLPPGDETLTLRSVQHEAVHDQLQALAAEPDCLVVGCAGLRSLLRKPIVPAPGAIATFLYGEIMPFGGGTDVVGPAMFGNLMAARIRRIG